MKKILFLISVITVVFLTSCTKSDVTPTPTPTPTYTLTLTVDNQSTTDAVFNVSYATDNGTTAGPLITLTTVTFKSCSKDTKTFTTTSPVKINFTFELDKDLNDPALLIEINGSPWGRVWNKTLTTPTMVDTISVK